jgi:hypothetical protein
MARFHPPVGALLVVVLLGACGTGGPIEPGESSRSAVPPTSELSTEPGERVVPSEGVAQVATLLTRALGEDRRFGEVVAGDDGDSLVLAWHGDPPTEAIESARSAYPDVAVTVQALPVLPGELRDAMEALVRDGDATGVNAAHMSSDWTAIVVLVDDAVAHDDGLADDLTARVGFPVRVEPGSIVPAGG